MEEGPGKHWKQNARWATEKQACLNSLSRGKSTDPPEHSLFSRASFQGCFALLSCLHTMFLSCSCSLLLISLLLFPSLTLFLPLPFFPPPSFLLSPHLMRQIPPPLVLSPRQDLAPISAAQTGQKPKCSLSFERGRLVGVTTRLETALKKPQNTRKRPAGNLRGKHVGANKSSAKSPHGTGQTGKKPHLRHGTDTHVAYGGPHAEITSFGAERETL